MPWWYTYPHKGVCVCEGGVWAQTDIAEAATAHGCQAGFQIALLTLQLRQSPHLLKFATWVCSWDAVHTMWFTLLKWAAQWRFSTFDHHRCVIPEYIHCTPNTHTAPQPQVYVVSFKGISFGHAFFSRLPIWFQQKPNHAIKTSFILH